MIFIGIDPGKSGAIAVVWDDGAVAGTVKLDQTEHDVMNFLRQFDLENARAVLEKVSSSPQMGVASSFTFGNSFGFLRGILTGLEISFEFASPQKWQKEMDCRSGGDKNVTKAAAQRLFPREKITHKNADALLLAEFCRRAHAARETA